MPVSVSPKRYFQALYYLEVEVVFFLPDRPFLMVPDVISFYRVVNQILV